MTLSSAFEDLQQTTLKAIAGCLRGLEYVAGLRERDNSYEHWGLSRVHGELPAQKALTQAHRSLLSQVLSTPIRELLDDVGESSNLSGIAPAAYVERLSTHSSELLPPEPGAGSARHLSSVLHALSSLLRSRAKDANRPTS